MMVGSQDTGEDRYGPDPCDVGMHAGTDRIAASGALLQSASRLLSHPQPGPGFSPVLEG